MNKAAEFYRKIPGKTVLKKYKARAVPPLWMWLRSGFYLCVGLFLNFVNLGNYGRIVITLAFLQLIGSSLAFFFQEVAAGYKRRFQPKKNTEEKKRSHDV